MLTSPKQFVGLTSNFRRILSNICTFDIYICKTKNRFFETYKWIKALKTCRTEVKVQLKKKICFLNPESVYPISILVPIGKKNCTIYA